MQEYFNSFTKQKEAIPINKQHTRDEFSKIIIAYRFKNISLETFIFKIIDNFVCPDDVKLFFCICPIDISEQAVHRMKALKLLDEDCNLSSNADMLFSNDADIQFRLQRIYSGLEILKTYLKSTEKKETNQEDWLSSKKLGEWYRNSLTER